MRSWWLPVLLGVSPAVHAGHPPAVETITFRPGVPADAAAALTFGLAVTHDGGATWRWMCESAIGYGGHYTPDYAYTATGALFATTFDGLKVNRSGCAFSATSLGTTFVSHIALAGDGALHVSAADISDWKLYRSDDDGVTFPTSANPGIVGDWWSSMRVAPGDPQRVYLTGYRFEPTSSKVQFAFASTNAGASYSPIAIAGSPTASSAVTIVDIAAANPDVVFARLAHDAVVGHGIYRSTNGGESWTLVFSDSEPLAFLARANGDLVVANGTFAWRSTDRGDSWTALTSPPHITCLAEAATGELWACTSWQLDGSAIMKSTDLASWTSVLRLQDLAPVQCPQGTVQHETCRPKWCNELAYVLGAMPCAVTPDGPIDAGIDIGADAGGIPDAGGHAGTGDNAAGCCGTGSGPTQLAMLATLVALGLRRRRG